MTRSPRNGITDFIIAHPGTKRAIGKIGIWQDEEIGFILARQYWGLGIAREALLAILTYAFNEKDMQEITADVDPRNERSIKLLESVGFVKTGFKQNTLQVGEEWVDSVYFGLKRRAWEELRMEASEKATKGEALN
jgi:[ribosomal protein S5]-alanine N-acetyltransferase